MTPHPAPTDATDLPHAAPADALSAPVADAVAGNWVDRNAPAVARPYLRLARMDRPIGTWLLLFPCWWSLALAEVSRLQPYPNVWYLALFAVGALAMRGAGCAYNDYVDRDYDAQVARTASRPIPSGQVRPRQALLFAVALALVGFVVLIQFNTFTIWLGISSLGLVALYPFMKRITYWPQLVLGLAFNWGALMGWAAVKGSLSAAPLLLYAGSVLWTIGYDTIYAHQDKEDDLMLGLKSTALRFGERDGRLGRRILCGCGGAVGAGGRGGGCTPDFLYGAGADLAAARVAGHLARHHRRQELPQTVPVEPGRRRRAVPGTGGRHGFVALSRIGVNPSPDAIRRGSGFASPAPNATPHVEPLSGRLSRPCTDHVTAAFRPA